MVNKLLSLDPKITNFDDACTQIISATQSKWFDPVITSDIVSSNDICDAFKELYLQLNY